MSEREDTRHILAQRAKDKPWPESEESQRGVVDWS